MNKKMKKDFDDVVGGLVGDINNYDNPEGKGKALQDAIKGINTIKEIESQEVENTIKKKKLKLDEERLLLEKERLLLEKDKNYNDKERLLLEKDKNYNEERRFQLDKARLEFEEKKFDIESKTSRKDKVINTVMKVVEVGVPLLVYGGLSVLALKATYKDDVRVPSDTWNFIRSVSKK